ncbi:MAG TPA: IS1595 family transposase [Rhizomicrobium sp.]|nr:IS1595 family transposase [Rhizomicrobium sp.]
MTVNLKAKIYTDETAARKHLEKLHWPNGTICPHCGVVGEATELKGDSTRPGVWKCRACEKPFTVTVGTVFEDSKVPLTKWLLAAQLLTSSKKGISSHQLSRMLGVTYKTAWFMGHRIREMMAPAPDAPPMGGEGQIIEVDETYIGRKKGRTAPKGGSGHKHAVVALVERGGKVRSVYAPKVGSGDVRKILRANVSQEAHIRTDENPVYGQLVRYASHEKVNHSKDEYVRGDAYTNTVEGVFSIFKRGMIGTYQHCGEQHLQRYLNEFDFRYSHREKLGVNDAMRAEAALKGAKGKRLTYHRLDSR